jgi:formylglycine-generating enzyme required for sulfatase activity
MIAGASSVCTDGVCMMTTCAAGLGDCDRMAANGCETNLGTSAMHCGRCGNACSLAHARTSCAGGACAIDACESGYANCDGDASNGCETETNTSVTNCGACGRMCPAGRWCAAGVCSTALSQRSCMVPSTPGCGVVMIAGGTFTMGAPSCAEVSTPDCGQDSAPQQASVGVGDFALDAYEVTVARFNMYWAVRTMEMTRVRGTPIRYRGGTIAWQAFDAEPGRQSSTCNWLPASSTRDAHPVNCVGYWTAQEFCVWDGGHLPTEAEWEYAARGSMRGGLAPGRIYPWGDAAPSRESCDRARWDSGSCSGEDGGSTRRVGSFASTAGLFDMAGNVEEWVADRYTPYGTGTSSPCGNRSGLTNPLCNDDAMPFASRGARGGAWNQILFDTALRSASRRSFTPGIGAAFAGNGFRCARDVP